MSEMCCTLLAEIQDAKNRHFGTIAQLCRDVSSQLRHLLTIGKKLLNIDRPTSSTCPYNMVNFGLLTAEICWRVWGTPSNFNGFRVLAALPHGTLVVGVSQTLRRLTEGFTLSIGPHSSSILFSSPNLSRSRRRLDVYRTSTNGVDLDPHLIHGSLGPPASSTQTASRSVQPFLQGSQLTDRPTDIPRCFVSNKRPRLRSTAMRSHNKLISVADAHAFEMVLQCG